MNPEKITDYIREEFAEKRNVSAKFTCNDRNYKRINLPRHQYVMDTDKFIDKYLKPFITNELHKQHYTITYDSDYYGWHSMVVSIIQLAFEDDAHILK